MRTGSTKWVQSECSYVANLFDAGMHGVVDGWRGNSERQLFSPLYAIWAPVALGAVVGVASACLNRGRSKLGYRAAMNGLVGSALGLGIGFAWTSRACSEAAVRGATRSVNAVRDAHWVERNPVAYG
jgi:hypothetical protein